MTNAVSLCADSILFSQALPGKTENSTCNFENILELSGQTGLQLNTTAKTGLTYISTGFSGMLNENITPEKIIENIIDKTEEKYSADNDGSLSYNDKNKLMKLSQLLDLAISLMMSKTMDGKYEAGDYPKLSELIKDVTSVLNNLGTMDTKALDELLETLTDFILELAKETDIDSGFEKSDKFEKMCRERIKQYEAQNSIQLMNNGEVKYLSGLMLQ